MRGGRSGSGGRESSPNYKPKKFKMLKELARLNGELRTKKPYSPTPEEKQKEYESNWTGAVRSSSYLKRKEGIGGGNIPGYSKL